MEPENTQGPRAAEEVRAVMFRHGLSILSVAKATGRNANYRTVYRALDPATAGGVRHGATVAVRHTVERMLRERGWTGESASLWEPIDAPMAEQRRAA